MEKLIAIISGDGTVVLETENIKGQGCDKVADQIMVQLGAKTNSEKKKPEYWDGGDDPVKILSNL